MLIIQMNGFNACANYCEVYIDYTTGGLPRYKSVQKHVEHARSTVRVKHILGKAEEISQWVCEFEMKEFANEQPMNI